MNAEEAAEVRDFFNEDSPNAESVSEIFLKYGSKEEALAFHGEVTRAYREHLSSGVMEKFAVEELPAMNSGFASLLVDGIPFKKGAASDKELFFIKAVLRNAKHRMEKAAERMIVAQAMFKELVSSPMPPPKPMPKPPPPPPMVYRDLKG